MKKYIFITVLLSLCLGAYAKQSATQAIAENEKEAPLNVLVFMIDDLRADLGIYGHKHVVSPNIDQLANEGLRFTKAFSQQAICGPSRVSIMTGLRPETTGLYTIRRDGRLRPNQPNIVSMPQLFKENGYKTVSIGKVYHSVTDDEENWTTHIKKLDNFYSIAGNAEKKFAYEAGEVEDDFYKDGKVASDAITTLKQLKDDKFLMFVGFSKPHLPFNAPKKYWDLYDPEQFAVPSRDKPDDMFRLALTKWGELRMYGGIPKEGDLNDELTKTLIHGYYATVSYMDAQVGKVMQALNDLGLRENTMVVFMSDHGYKLGEYGAWNKHTNMELDTRVPLIISRELSHKGRQTGAVSSALVENVDIFPSVAEAAGLPVPKIDGTSLLALLDKPDMQWKEAAYSLFTRGSTMGVTVTDGAWRYTQWRDAATQEVNFTELYDHRVSDVASANVSGLPQHQKIEQRLKTLLNKRFPLDAPSFYEKRDVNNMPSVKANMQKQTTDDLHPNNAIIAESFENGGWNAVSPRGFTPGLKEDIDKNFLFNQLQGNHAFVLDEQIVRSGKHSAKLLWKHKNPATFNGDKNKVDNVDRKAMFHGYKTRKVMGAEAWYGFSVYFPSEGTRDELNNWLFFQIHASADKRLNEVSRNPPFSLTLTKDGLRGSWKWDPDEKSLTTSGKGTQRYTIDGDKADYLDRWVDFVVHVKVDYSQAKTAFIELWVDGKKVLDEHDIQFGYNDDKGIYPSWGMYFNGDLSVMEHDHYLYLDAIKMTDDPNASYEDVAPR